jgi:hypothetical protein
VTSLLLPLHFPFFISSFLPRLSLEESASEPSTTAAAGSVLLRVGRSPIRPRPRSGRKRRRRVGPHAHLAAGNSITDIPSLHRLGHGLGELALAVDGGEPERERGGVVVARAGAVAFDVGRRAEVLEAGARRGEGLSCALGAGSSVLK